MIIIYFDLVQPQIGVYFIILNWFQYLILTKGVDLLIQLIIIMSYFPILIEVYLLLPFLIVLIFTSILISLFLLVYESLHLIFSFILSLVPLIITKIRLISILINLTCQSFSSHIQL